MSETVEEPSLPNPSKSEGNKTLSDMSTSIKTDNIGGSGDSVLCNKDLDSVSVKSDTSTTSERKVGAKPSGIKPPSKISRPCAGAHKPALPVSPPKSESLFYFYY